MSTENFETFLHYFYHWEQVNPDKVYLRQPFGDRWVEYTYAEVGRMARQVAAALREKYEPGTMIGMVSKNCVEWLIADLGMLMGGFVSVPFYPTLTADQLREVLSLSGAQALFVGKLDDWDKMKGGVPDHVEQIAFPHYEGNAVVENARPWADIIDSVEPLAEPHQPTRDELFTVIYTSGTTGTPKGVMLTYDCVRLVIEAEREADVYRTFTGAGERYFSYLPLNHVAERVGTEISGIVSGGTVSFSESLDRFAQNLQDVQPTLFIAVPRIWTRFQMAILGQMPQSRLDLLLKIPVVSGLVKARVQKALGLSEAVTILAGAAPLPAATLEWFSKLDINIQEVYGMSETCGGVTVVPKGKIKAGTVGKALPGCEVKLDPETDEVLMKVPWIMAGYYKDEAKTAEVLRDGWIHSGDQGRFDEDGYLIITGRVKDTFKSAKGKFVIPVPIEAEFAKNHFVEQVAVVGRGVPQPLALINLSEVGQLEPMLTVQESLQETLDRVNAELPNYQRIKTVVVLPETWSVDNGLLTPTMKLKRNVLDHRFEGEYMRWYEAGEPILWDKQAS